MNNIDDLRKEYQKINRLKENNQNDLVCKIQRYKELFGKFKTPYSKEDTRLINLIKNRIKILQDKIEIKPTTLGTIDYTKEINYFKNKLINNKYFPNKLLYTIYFCNFCFLDEKDIDNYIKYFLKNSVTFGWFPFELWDKNNRTNAKFLGININDFKEKNETYYNYMSYFLTSLSNKQGFIIKALITEYSKITDNEIIKQELKDLLINSKFIKPENLDSYVNAFYQLIANDDIETCLQKLSSLLENSLKYICENNKINPYKIKTSKKEKENLVESSNMFGFLISLDKIKKILGKDVCFNIKYLFDDGYGINIRNNIAHGIWDSNDYKNNTNYYAAIYILWLCIGYK